MLPLNSESIDQIMSALAKAQAEITPAVKDSANPYFKSKYADLSSISNACRVPLSTAGIAVTQSLITIEGQLTLVTTLGHSSGQWLRSYAPIITAKMDSQSVGSACTYMRRYSLASICGVVTDDDDGEASMARASSINSMRSPMRSSIPPKQPYVEAQEPAISKEQADALSCILRGCSEGYRNTLNKYLDSKGIDVHGIPKSMFDQIVAKAQNDFAKCEMAVAV